MTDNKMAITFNSFDDTDDGNIMTESQLKVDIISDTLENLYTRDLTIYKEGCSLVAFVKNINATSGTIPYRGSFYKYDWTRHGWQQIIVGTHSHANMAILNQLGNIDINKMKIGDEKVLTITRVDKDASPEELAYGYKLEYTDQKSLPQIPDDFKGKDLYLTVDKDGSFKWENKFTPAQSFKLFKETLSDGIKINNKSLFFSNSYLFQKNIRYDENSKDSLILFDDGKLISNIMVTTTSDGLNISLTDDNEFSNGEEVVCLIIRDGISGILDTIKDQYITKDDAINLLTNGTVNLTSYTTTSEMKKYVDEHVPFDYIKKSDYDAFDFRYADYRHTHAEYMTKENVLALLSDLTDDGSIDLTQNNTFQELTSALQNKITTLNDQYLTKDQLAALITEVKDEIYDSDNIIIQGDGRNLTKYLDFILSKVTTATTMYADDIVLPKLVVNIGENESIGGISSGTTYEKGTSLAKFLHDITTKEVRPTFELPEIELPYTISTTEAGATAKFVLNPKYIKHDGGMLKEISIKIFNNSEMTEPLYDIVLNEIRQYSVTLPMNAFNSNNLCYRVVVDVNYTAGNSVKSNIGFSYNLPEGTLHKVIDLYNERRFICGTIKTNIDQLKAEDIYNALSTNYMNSNVLTEDNYLYGIDRTFSTDSFGKIIIFALPKSSKYRIKNIIFKNQYFDMIDDFEHVTFDIPDISGKIDNNINNNYDVYYFNLTRYIRSNMLFKILFDKEI